MTSRPRTARPVTRRQWWTFAVIATVLVVAGSLAPASTAGELTAGADKLLHGVGYGVIAFFIAGARSARTARQLAVVVGAVTLLGVGVELVQPLVGRDASALDALANLVGATAGAVAFELSRNR